MLLAGLPASLIAAGRPRLHGDGMTLVTSVVHLQV
jgi:hypothetical protein